MDDLGGALRELAREAQAPAPADPAALWKRGRRRLRARRVGAATLAAVLVVLVGAAGLAGPEPRLVTPAAAPSGPGIPRDVEDPPGWLPTADYGTKVGPLSVLARGLQGDRMRLFGINAATGRYRFLDLPDQVPDTPVALSPDGRWVAYWAGSSGRTVTLLTAFDTVTGTMSGLSGDTESRFGLEPGALTWLDDDTLLLQFAQRRARAGGYVVPESSWKTETFQPDGAGPEEFPIRPVDGAVWSRSRSGDLLVAMAPSSRPGPNPTLSWEGRDTAMRSNGTELRLPNGNYRQVSRSDTFGLAVGTVADGSPGTAVGTSGPGHELLAGPVDQHGAVASLRDVGDLYVGTLLGWRSDHSVLVTGWRGDPRGQASLYEADLATGRATRVGDAGDDVDVVLAVASDLLGEPFVDAHPPRGLDPRLARGGMIGALLVLGCGVVLWRRRVRR